MTNYNKYTVFAVVSPEGEVIDKWFESKDLNYLAQEIGITKKDVTINLVCHLLEKKGYFISQYSVPNLDTRIPKEDIVDDWNYNVN